MTPKEKAEQLVVNSRAEIDITSNQSAKQYALIAVNEILQIDGWSSSRLEWDMFASYWNKVKQEIELL